MVTINTPTIVNHLDPYIFINLVNKFPNLYDKKETKKNRNPLDTKLIKIKIIILNPIKPLAIVKTLYGNGVKPAKKSTPSQA